MGYFREVPWWNFYPYETSYHYYYFRVLNFMKTLSSDILYEFKLNILCLIGPARSTYQRQVGVCRYKVEMGRGY